MRYDVWAAWAGCAVTRKERRTTNRMPIQLGRTCGLPVLAAIAGSPLRRHLIAVFTSNPSGKRLW